MSKTVLHLFKQNFKFSSAHFLIFDAHHAERLHGHNYQVRVDLGMAEDQSFSDKGYFVDFNVFKNFIKKTVDQWDEHILLPGLHPEMHFTEKGPSLEVRFRDRFYVFPKDEVIRLPVNNTSVEQFSKLLCEKFFAEFSLSGVEKIRVLVEETKGQGASFTIKAEARA